jgi:hypothetical protein
MKVKIIYTTERGHIEYAVVLAQDEDDWLDAFPSIQEAQHYCVMNDLTVVTWESLRPIAGE